ncbi:hypothetical protein PHLCEN_2v10182 [Hermanssonia centrifuga]|uniref:Uncharacterized protein n=1 Tax=Hermanssonia centrifuga TaxID=98765 RepID=A0A2R6NNJ6_9APHY|nr:hypothetical protein PHLCEN_2v10182 [Hermanssonia centrifuga]
MTSASDFVPWLYLFASIDVLRILVSNPDSSHIDVPDNAISVATHPSLVTTQPYFPSHLKISSTVVGEGGFTPFLLGLIQKTASMETINKSVSPSVLDTLHLSACTALTNLTLRMRSRPDSRQANATTLEAASALIACAATVQTVTLDVLIHGYLDVSWGSSSANNITAEFIRLQL